jgi:SAM-dependent methyltransferase
MNPTSQRTPAKSGENPQDTGAASAAGQRRQAAELVPYLARRMGTPFRGRILEIGTDPGWLSGELSKLPGVVEIIVLDKAVSRGKAAPPAAKHAAASIESKIFRRSGVLQALKFPDDHFDFVVCAAVLNRTVNMVSMLREVRRVLKPGGRFVAVREPVSPFLPLRSSKSPSDRTRDGRLIYSLEDYARFFTAAGLLAEFKRVNLGSGMKYFFDQVFNGLTHARYALIASKSARGSKSLSAKKAHGAVVETLM